MYRKFEENEFTSSQLNEIIDNAKATNNELDFIKFTKSHLYKTLRDPKFCNYTTYIFLRGFSNINWRELKFAGFILNLPVLSDARLPRVEAPNFFLDELIDFIAFKFSTEREFDIGSIHGILSQIIELALISPYAIACETDFSHKKNITVKYYFRLDDIKATRTPSIRRTRGLFISPEFINGTGTRTSFVKNIQMVFDEEVSQNNKVERLNESEVSTYAKRARYGYFAMVGKSDSYTIAYLIPLSRQIVKGSEIFRLIDRIFSLIFEVANKIGGAKVESNVYRSRLRHTIAVQYQYALESLNAIMGIRNQIISKYSGDKDELNLNFTRLNDHILTLGRFVESEFKNDYDAIGAKVSVQEKSRKALVRTFSGRDIVDIVDREARGVLFEGRRCNISWTSIDPANVEILDVDAFFSGIKEVLTNATKYNITDYRINGALNLDAPSDELILTISNVGPSLSDAEQAEIPMMGLRGVRAQQLVSAGSGQGLAAAFNSFENAGVAARFSQRPLTQSTIRALAPIFGTKALVAGKLAECVVSIKMPLVD